MAKTSHIFIAIIINDLRQNGSETGLSLMGPEAKESGEDLVLHGVNPVEPPQLLADSTALMAMLHGFGGLPDSGRRLVV